MLPGYYIFIGGICLVVIGALLKAGAPFARDRTSLNWLVTALIALGLGRIFMAFTTLLPDRVFFLFEAVARIVATHAFLEFARQVLATHICNALQVHLPLATALISLYALSAGRASPSLLVVMSLVRLLACWAGIKFASRLPPESRRFGIAAFIVAIPMILVQGVLHLVMANAGIGFSQITEKWLLKFYFDLASLGVIMILVLLAGFAREKAHKLSSPAVQYIPAAIALAIMAVTVFGLHLSHQVALNNFNNSKARLEQAVQSLGKIVDQRIAFVSTASAILAAAPIMSGYLANPDADNFRRLNHFIEAFSQRNPGSICYIMNDSGLVKAASDLKQLFIGKDLSFRRYFQDSMTGKYSLQADVGVLTNTLGFYAGSPIRKDENGPVIGVCAVKRNLDDLDQTFKMYHPAMLIDASGTVILASNRSLLGTSLPSLAGISSTVKPFAETKVDLPGIDANQYLFGLATLELLNCRMIMLLPSDAGFNQSWVFSIILLIVIVFLAVLSSFTRHIESVRSIEAAQNHFKALFENAPESILVVSVPGLKVVEANQSMLRQFQLQALPVGLLYPALMPQGRLKITNAWHSVSKQMFKHQREFRKQGGEIFFAEVIGSVIDFNGEKSLLLILHDITVHHEVENRLREAKNAAEEANSLKARFFANASHEIRTPMTAIIGLTELAVDACQEEKLKRLIELIRTSSKAMLTLLNDILELAQIESGKLAINPVQFNLPLLLHDLIEIIRFQAEKNAVRAELKVAATIPEIVIADPDRIRQILLNLLANAVRFTRHGVISLTADLSTDRNGHYSVDFMVSDTGMGISDEMKRNLFGAFVFNDPFVKNDAQNGNLGLSISKQLIDLMGGSINVDSRPGEGTTFRVSIPVACKDIATPGVHASPLLNLELIRDGRPLHFLIADDNDINLFLASSIIERFKGTSQCVNDGVEVLEAVGKSSYDAILLDIQMPRLDGIATLKELQKTTAASIPVVAISAFASDQEKNLARDAGAKAYLGKPYFPEDLFVILKNLLLDQPCSGFGAADSGESTFVAERVLEPTEPRQVTTGSGLRQINREELELRVLKKPENILQINEIYQRRSQMLVAAIDECLQTSDSAKLRDTAHSIKGLAGMLAANTTFELARDIETLSRDGKFAEAAAMVPALKLQLHDISRDLLFLTAEIEKKLV